MLLQLNIMNLKMRLLHIGVKLLKICAQSRTFSENTRSVHRKLVCTGYVPS